MDEIEFKLQVIERLSKIEALSKLNSATFEKHIEQDEVIAADVSKKLTNIELILDRNTTSLEVHMKRTNQLEDRTEQMENHVVEIGGVLKFLKGLGWFIGVLVSVLAVLKAIGII